MRITIFSLFLLVEFIFAGCVNKHPKIGLIVQIFETQRWKNDQK
jgi:hypothetical protein